MERGLNSIQPKYYGLISAFLAMLGMYLILSYNQCIGGDITLLTGDMIEQYVPYIKMLCRDILNGESIWFSWSSSLGMNTSLINAYYAMSPFNIFYLLFWNVDVNIITAIIIILKNGIAAYTFHIFLKRVMRCEGIQSILFSVMYALSMYMVNYGFIYNSWMDGVILLPLICTYIYELETNKKSYLKLIVSYVVLFISQFYIGYMVGIFSFLFLIVLLFTGEKKTFSAILKRILKYAGSVVLAIGIVALFLLPALIFLITNNPEDASEFQSLEIKIYEWLYALFWGSSVPMLNSYPALYCGWPILILVPLFFFNKEIEIKEKIRYGILVFFIVLTTIINPLYQLMHAFDAPNFHNHRHAFLIVFLFCALAAKQSMYVKAIKMKNLIFVLIGYLVIYPILAWFSDIEHTDFTFKVIVNIALALIWFGLWFLLVKNKINKQGIAILTVLFLLVELFANGWYIIDTSDNYHSEVYGVWKDGITEAVSEINTDDDFYRMYYQIDMITNSDSWFGYNGVSDFSSAENYNLRQSMQHLGVYTSPRVFAPLGTGMTPPVEALLGVKYIVLGPDPYIDLSEENYYQINENKYCLNLGYMVSDDIINYEYDSLNSFENINSLMQIISGEKSRCFEKYVGQVVVESENVEIVIGDELTAMRYDTNLYEYGMVTYSVIKENVEGPIYIQFPREESVLFEDAPYLPGGYENIFHKHGSLTVPYIKPLLIGEEEYAMAVMMNETTVNEFSFETPIFYEYNEAALAQIHNTLSQSQMEVEEYADGYVKGNVTVPEERTVLFTSIPYDEGWTVWVDGIEKEAIAVVGDAFLALELEPGYHELEFEYEAPGLKAGMGISAVSIGIYIALIVTVCVKEKKEKNINTQEES